MLIRTFLVDSAGPKKQEEEVIAANVEQTQEKTENKQTDNIQNTVYSILYMQACIMEFQETLRFDFVFKTAITFLTDV